MFLTRSEYGIIEGVNTFSPEGRLFQGALDSPTTEIGLLKVSSRICYRSYQGVVLAVEKRVQSPLLESSSIEKIMEIDTHLGCAIVLRLCAIWHCEFGESVHDEDAMMSRPFGVALLIAGVDELDHNCEYHTDPSGTFMRTQSELQDKWHKQMTLLEAQKLTLRVLKQTITQRSVAQARAYLPFLPNIHNRLRHRSRHRE
ncbi:proteasome subunit alpha type 5, partial [Suillus ampliporus]